MKSKARYLWMLLLTCFLLMGIYASLKITPFGDKVLLGDDMGIQYVDFMNYLVNLMKTADNSFLFSWNISAGGNFLALFMYYLSSPITIACLFIFVVLGNVNIVTTVSFIIVIKLALMAASMLFYLDRKYNQKTIYGIAFSLAYAFSGYAIVYSESIMWMDGLILLPIILVYIDKIIAGKQCLSLIFIITLLVISNFYIGYMVILFSGFYFVWQYVRGKEKVMYKQLFIELIKYICLVAIGCLLASVLLIPTFISIIENRVTNTSGASIVDLNNLKSLFQILVGQSNYITAKTFPLLYCGIGTVCLFIYRFLSIGKRKQFIVDIVAFVILISGIFVPIINKAWHLFLEPVGYPFRWMFAVVFFIILVSYEAILQLRIQKRTIIIFSLAGLLFLGQYYLYSNYINQFIYINLIFIIIFIVLMIFVKKELIAVILILEVCFNAFYSLSIYIDYSGTYTNYVRHDMEIKQLLPKKGYFRMETTTVRAKLETIPLSNEAMTYGYRSLSGHSSIYNKNYVDFARKMGYEVWTFGVMYSSINPFIDSLLGLKYVITEDLDYLECTSNDGLKLCENNYALPLAFTSSNDIDINLGNNAIDNQNVISRLVSTDDVYVELKSSSKGVVNGYTNEGNIHLKNDSQLNKQEIIEIEVDGDNSHIFIYFENADINNVMSISTSIPASNELYLHAGENNKVLYLGASKDQSKIDVRINQISDVAIYDNVKIYSLNVDALISLNKLKENEVIKDNDKLIVEAAETSYLYVTIPIQDGIYIRGNKNQVVDSWLDCFYKIELLPGTNIITFSYIPKGLIFGILISFITSGTLIVYLFLTKRKANKTVTVSKDNTQV